MIRGKGQKCPDEWCRKQAIASFLLGHTDEEVGPGQRCKDWDSCSPTWTSGSFASEFLNLICDFQDTDEEVGLGQRGKDRGNSSPSWTSGSSAPDCT
ncbi:hypothetical protein AVEN_249396-1 [Araneus ventricosus]|uniref:Uncharacterized protein n=1 Tax=Araneus ventricosus TaxID=182803 RepID=A0A4Y2IBX5_ARAVE|nr:hypothetical protein AVEN_249396-1 [Araneus ventricosus]